MMLDEPLVRCAFSKLLRLSLCSWGDRITTKTFFSVGSGRADRGASTLCGHPQILRAELSMTSWSPFEPDADLLSRHAQCTSSRTDSPPVPHSGVSAVVRAIRAQDRRLVQSWAYCPIHT